MDEELEGVKMQIEGWKTEDLQELGSFIESILMAREEEATI